MNEERKHLHEIIDDFNDAMLTTFGADGRPESRPMHVAKVTDGSDLWFVTHKESRMANHILSNPMVCITMQGGGKFVSLTGKALLVFDRSRLDEVWSDAWKIWFPDGKTDPSIVLLKVTTEEGAFWDVSGINRLRYLYEAGKAYFTGQEFDADAVDMSGKVKL